MENIENRVVFARVRYVFRQALRSLVAEVDKSRMRMLGSEQ